MSGWHANTRRSQAVEDLKAKFATDDFRQEIADARDLVKIPAFRRFLASVHGRARLAKMTYDGGPISPVQLGYANGRKEMAKEILAVVDRAAPEGYWQALTERRTLENERAREIETAANGENEND